MKTVATIIGSLVGIACVFAFNVQSDEPIKANAQPTFLTSPIGQELLDTLDLAFSERLAEYKGGRGVVNGVIRLNKKLYLEQISAANASSQRVVTENYVERAKQVEALAERNFENGTATSADLLEAKAARLSAALELAKL